MYIQDKYMYMCIYIYIYVCILYIYIYIYTLYCNFAIFQHSTGSCFHVAGQDGLEIERLEGQIQEYSLV